jgi:hypothetical protein
MAQSAWDLRNSDAALRREIERWLRDLAVWEAEGLVDSNPAKTVRDWIAAVEKMLARPPSPGVA